MPMAVRVRYDGASSSADFAVRLRVSARNAAMVLSDRFCAAPSLGVSPVEEGVMHRMNFEQRGGAEARAPRDIGGLPSPALLLAATALVLWMLGLALRGTL